MSTPFSYSSRFEVGVMLPAEGVEVVFDRRFIRRSRDFVLTEENGRPLIIAYSKEVLLLHLAQQDFVRRAPIGTHFPLWHDDSENCSTWTDEGGCRCEVDP